MGVLLLLLLALPIARILAHKAVGTGGRRAFVYNVSVALYDVTELKRSLLPSHPGGCWGSRRKNSICAQGRGSIAGQ